MTGAIESVAGPAPLKVAIRRGIVWHYTGRTVIAGATFGTTVLLVRLLSREEFGAYTLLQSFLQVLGVVAVGGFSHVLARYLPEFEESHQTDAATALVGWSVLLTCTVAAVAALATLLLRDLVDAVFQIPAYAFPLTLALIVAMVPHAFVMTVRNVLFPQLRYRFWAFSESVFTLVRLVAYASVLTAGYGVSGVLVAFVVCETFLAVIYTGALPRDGQGMPRPALPPALRAELRRILRYGAVNYPHGVVALLQERAPDTMLLAYFWGPEAAALYAIAFGVPYMLLSWAPPNMARGLATTYLVRRFAMSRDLAEVRKYLGVMLKLTCFLGLPPFLLGAVLAENIVLVIFGQRYSDAVGLFALSLALLAVWQFAYIYSAVVRTLEMLRAIAVSAVFPILNLLAALVLIPWLGVVGAVLATAGSGVLMASYYMVVVGHRAGPHADWPGLARIGINLGSVVGIGLLLKPHAATLPALLGVALVLVIVYTLLSLVNRPFTLTERSIINALIGRKVWRF